MKFFKFTKFYPPRRARFAHTHAQTHTHYESQHQRKVSIQSFLFLIACLTYLRFTY